MSIRLSQTKIESFSMNVLPLYFVGEEKWEERSISWRLEGECVSMRDFSRDADHPISSGVLLTLLKPGEARVIASLDGEEYICSIKVREMKRASLEDEMQYFIGDFHDHTSIEHKHDLFADREKGFPIDYLEQIRAEGKLDFGVISDHSDVINSRDFFRGFTDLEKSEPMGMVIFPGSEAEVNVSDPDRYGVPHKSSGEMVIVNSDRFPWQESWEAFYEEMESAPFAVLALAHPQEMGSGKLYKGIWNFHLERKITEGLKKYAKLVEVTNGFDEFYGSNLIHEYVYSQALDRGFRVSTSRGSDSHGPRWGAEIFEGKTVIMAPEKSKEAFLDALFSQRVYCCQSGNIKLRYSVNGRTAPCDLPPASSYDFHVEIGTFREDPTTHPIRCQVISDEGICVKTIEGELSSSFDIHIESATARYFFLRLMDEKGRKTWSPPVWTGRSFDPYDGAVLSPVPKEGFHALEEISGMDASVLLSDDPYQHFTSKDSTASILVDMGKEREISALGVYHRIVTKSLLEESGLTPSGKDIWVREFPSEFILSTSLDGKNFAVVKKGIFRAFGGEEIIRFDQRSARFVRLEILSTVGKESGCPAFADAKVSLAEITLFS